MTILALSIFIISLWIAIFALIELRKLRKQYTETVKKVVVICEKLPVPEPLYEEGHTFRHHEPIIAGFRIHIVDRHFIVLSRYYNKQDLVWKYVVLDQRNNAETVDETFVKRHSPPAKKKKKIF